MKPSTLLDIGAWLTTFLGAWLFSNDHVFPGIVWLLASIRLHVKYLLVSDPS